MSDLIVSKLNSLSLKIVPIIIILYCLLSIVSSFMGYGLSTEIPATTRLLSRNKTRKSTIFLHMFISFIVLIISMLYLRSVW